MTQRAFIYCRISKDREGASLGVQRQEEDCLKLAADKGLEVVEVFTDNDLSAYSGKPRPSYLAMLDGLAEGRADVVLCWHTDRLHRSSAELEHYVKVCDPASIATHTVTEGRIDLATPNGRLMAGLQGLLARHESEHKSERLKRKMQELKAAGKWTGGVRPFGWDVVDSRLVINPAEAAAVAQLFSDALAGRSMGALARSLNDAGFRSTRGNPFSATTVRYLMLKPGNAGLTEDGRPTEAQALVTEDVYRAVLSLINDPKRNRSHTNTPKHLLVGIAQCHCGGKVISANPAARGGGQKYPTYKCSVPGRGHVAKRVSHVDDYVNTLVVVARATASRAERSAESIQAARVLEVEANDIRARESEVALMAAHNKMSLSQLSLMNKAMAERLSLVESALAELALAESLPTGERRPYTDEEFGADMAEWLALPIDDRRDYVRRILNVVLLPLPKDAPRAFDPATVQVIFKHPGDPRGLLPAEGLSSLKTHWRETGLLPA